MIMIIMLVRTWHGLDIYDPVDIYIDAAVLAMMAMADSADSPCNSGYSPPDGDS